MTSHLADQLCHAMGGIHARGWCDGTGGNFSCVLQREPLRLLMAPSGVDKGSVQPGDLITVDGTGQVVAGKGRASAETPLHLEIVARTGAGAVLHTHSQAATLLSDWCLGTGPSGRLGLQDLEMLKGLEGITTHQQRVELPVLANDQDLERLSRAAAPLLADAPHGLLIAGHGLYAWGADLVRAQRHLEILEWLLEQRWRRLLLEGLGLIKSQIPVAQTPPVRAILLDIEGTTCPVRFVSEVLFPYARERLDAFLRERRDDPLLRPLITAIDTAIDAARSAEADPLLLEPGVPLEDGTGAGAHRARVRFLQRLIDEDRKLPALKELQGLIWDDGYGSGELIAPLFDDVAPALKGWQERGVELAVYSSGSVRAQQLLYRHCEAGDLSGCFRHWFDTRIGAKGEPASYTAIAEVMGLEPSTILFVSDAPAELEAADAAGLQTCFSLREGNPHRDPGRFRSISSLMEIVV